MNILLSVIKFLTIAYPVLFVLISIFILIVQILEVRNAKKKKQIVNSAATMVFCLGVVPIFFVMLPVELILVLILIFA